MFHTFAEEREDDPPVYGLIHNEQSFNQIHLQVTLIFHLKKTVLFSSTH